MGSDLSPYIVEKLNHALELSIDILDTDEHRTTYEAQAIICRFNYFWPKPMELFHWIFTKWTMDCEIHLYSKGFFILGTQRHYTPWETVVLRFYRTLHYPMVSEFWCKYYLCLENACLGPITQPPPTFLEWKCFRRHWKYLWEMHQNRYTTFGGEDLHIHMYMYQSRSQQRITGKHLV